MIGWKATAITDLSKELRRIYGISTFRIGTDYSQVLYLLPQSLAFGENVDEIGDDLDSAQVLMLCRSIQYSDEIMVWQNSELKEPELITARHPDIPPPPPEKTPEEKIRDLIDGNTALQHQLSELENRIEMTMRKNSELEKQNEILRKKMVMLETANSIMRKNNQPIT